MSMPCTKDPWPPRLSGDSAILVTTVLRGTLSGNRRQPARKRRTSAPTEIRRRCLFFGAEAVVLGADAGRWEEWRNLFFRFPLEPFFGPRTKADSRLSGLLTDRREPGRVKDREQDG
jgi:hypothetical protein